MGNTIKHKTLGTIRHYGEAKHSESLLVYDIYLTNEDKIICVPKAQDIKDIVVYDADIPSVEYVGEDRSGELVVHFKGGKYTYIGYVYDVYLKELLVEYISREDGEEWIRPSESFFGNVNQPRFKFVD